jgi:DNA helicase II / ATP-dependent DNA helicase PcrA
MAKNPESAALTPAQIPAANVPAPVTHAPAPAGRSRPEEPYLAGLNPEQRDAVETLDGPVLVLAGAGTGKTKALTSRIAHIIATRRARPYEILAVTFTNKAAREMKERIGCIVGAMVEGMPWLGTFHAIGVKILRRHAELVGLKHDFTILDMDDQLRLLKQLIEAEKIDEKRWPARQLASAIDSWKNRGLTPDRIPKGEIHSYANGKGAALYAAYQKRLKELNAADFGDLLLENLRLFQENSDVLKFYHERFAYILVDEYQDTNIAQYLWLRLLAQGNHNICCVGDDDQSIYGWRGAEVDNILRFEKDFPGAHVFRLERNYRSTAHILGAASGLIAHNRGRLGKTLRPEGETGDPVSIRSVWDDEEEARVIGDGIENMRRDGRLGEAGLNGVAILVRASFQMRAFEDRFLTMGLPYRVIGGPRFYERQEIKDAIAYLEITINPANDLKFERIANTPRRGLGDTTLKTLHQHARAMGIPLVQAARQLCETEELKAAPRKALSSLLADFSRWRGQLETVSHTDLAGIILDESGYTAMWQADKTPQAQTRLENLKELLKFMEEFESLGGFLEHVSLVMDATGETDGERVSLMTLHAAKGLEFDAVFLPGWEEALFPHVRSLEQEGERGLEEERRLAYVGLTRAKRYSAITYAKNRRVHGQWQSALPSRFLEELPSAHVEEAATTASYGAYGAYGRGGDFGGGYKSNGYNAGGGGGYDSPGWQRMQSNMARSGSGGGGASAGKQQYGPSKPPLKRRDPLTIDGAYRAEPKKQPIYTVGDRVFHQKFGYGKVTKIDGDKLHIDFEKAGPKLALASFVERAS